MLKAEPFQEILHQPSLGGHQPVEVSQVAPVFLMSFTSLSRKQFSEVTDVGVCAGRPLGVQIQRGLVQFSLGP